MNLSEQELKRQFLAAEKRGLVRILETYARKHSLPIAYVLAIASRETNITNVLGDNGHGYGPMQLDNRYWKSVIASHPNWRQDPSGLVDFCCRYLARLVGWAKDNFPNFDYYKIAAAAYNCGPRNALRGVRYGDCDRYTTGGDYGRDVREREEEFAELLEKRKG